jgi:hypothetical protein
MLEKEVIKIIDSLNKWQKFDIYLHYVFNMSYLKSYPTIINLYEKVDYRIGRGIPDFLNDNYAIYYCGKTHITQSFEEFIEEEPYKRNGITYHDLVGIYGHYKTFKNQIVI